MSDKYVPERGDTVRVVLEGEVSQVSGEWFNVSRDGYGTSVNLERGYFVSAEKVAPPLPTAEFSMIRCPGIGSEDDVYRVLVKGQWWLVGFAGGPCSASALVADRWEPFTPGGES
jgi:hypothetical protein